MMTLEELEEKYMELERGYRKLEAVVQCQNLVSRYCYYQASSMQPETVALFCQHTPDTRIERMGGIYEGIEGIRRCFLDERPQRGTDDIRLLGYMHVETTSTPVVEVAEDLETCRGAWICPGIETTAERGEAKGSWNWYKFGADFRQEDGQWKIWHMHLYKVFLSPYYVSWADVEPAAAPGAPPKGAELPPGFVMPHPDRGPSTSFAYAPDGVYPADQPAPPAPYRTFDEVENPY